MELIQPWKSGAELLSEIAETAPGAGTVCVWWLGQSGFLFKTRNGVLVIDPYLSEHLTAKYAGTSREHIRMTAAPCRGGDLGMVDLVLSSHRHSDHLDPGTLPDLLSASTRALLGLPEAILGHAEGLGLDAGRLVGLLAGGTIEAAGFRARAIPSAHEGLDTDDSGRHLYMGFVVEAEGRRFYHSGDSLAYGGLTDWLGDAPFDVMFLPINGRDPARGVPGNMTAAEAVDLASESRPEWVVPHHYDMFTFNTVPVSDFEAEAARLPSGVAARVLRCGERWDLNG